MPNILELCNARLTRVPEEPVEPKITPSGHGTVKKKSPGESTGNAGGMKRSRPLDAGSGVADSSRSNEHGNFKIKLKYLHANKVFYGFNSVNRIP